jgi:hypothetical protein
MEAHMADSATQNNVKRLAIGVLGGAAAVGVFYFAAGVDSNPALGTIILVFLVYTLHAKRFRDLETDVEIMRYEIEALKGRLDNRKRAIWKKLPEPTPNAWLTEWFTSEYGASKPMGGRYQRNSDE